MEVNIQHIVRHRLNQRPRTTRPLALVISFPRHRLIVGIVEVLAIAARVLRRQQRVINDPLQPIAIAALAGEPQQIPRQLRVRVAAARSLEMIARRSQAFAKLALMRRHERFLRPPSAGRELLRGLQHVPRVPDCREILRLAQYFVSPRRRTQRNHVTVRMLTGKQIAILRQRIEQLVIEQIQLRHLQILAVARQLVSVEQVLRQNIRLVIRSLLRAVRSAIVRMIRNMRYRSANHLHQHLLRGLVSGQLRCVQQSSLVLIEDVTRPCGRGLFTRERISVRTQRGGKSLHQRTYLRGACRVFRRTVNTRESGDVLPQRMAGHESVRVIPAAHIVAWRGQPCALPVDLEQSVIVQREEMAMNHVVLALQRAAREPDIRVTELVERAIVSGCRRPGRANGIRGSSGFQEFSPVHLV